MQNPFKRDTENGEAAERNQRFERMFETRSEAWERAGLTLQATQRAIRGAQRRTLVLLVLLIGVLLLWSNRNAWFGTCPPGVHICQNKMLSSGTNTWVEILTAIALVVLGWTFARDLGRAAAPTFFKRMDPSTAGTVGFLIRLVATAITLIVTARVVGFHPSTIVAGGAFTAVIFGLAAQQTLGNVIAGMVLLSARPFRVGERIRLQAGAVGGSTEGVVSSLGLLYTTLARGDDRIMIPNNVVLAAAVVPLREPEPVDVKVRLNTGIRPGQVQALLDEAINTPTRSEPRVLLEEIDGDDVVVRVQATPERAADGARLADEIINTLASVTSEHALVSDRSGDS
ncbi:MAG: mechanosensitive ion channel family protein [Actinobacteria bacterium]|nr:MAG: mechanosensitive ion channel family protein [Actinomycetota bacterium]